MNKYFTPDVIQPIYDSLNEEQKAFVDEYIALVNRKNITKNDIIMQYKKDYVSNNYSDDYVPNKAHLQELYDTLKTAKFPSKCKDSGICYNANIRGMVSYVFSGVCSDAAGFKSRIFPVPHTSGSFWEGDQLIMRVAYLNFLIKCLETFLAD